MIAQELEVSLHMAFVEARQKQHEFITVEHLLLAMLDNPSAAEVLKACGVDLDEQVRRAHHRLGGVDELDALLASRADDAQGLHGG